MPKAMDSVPYPVSFTFDNGAVVITSVIDSDSEKHLPPAISGQLLVQMFITKEEEQALGIPERNTVDWRRENRIPDSDDIQTWLSRKRSDTVSTTHSDSRKTGLER
jgi:hypothetical protein